MAHNVSEGAQGGEPSSLTATNWPDHLTNSNNLVFVHGINVTDGNSCVWPASMPYRGVLSEVFKRFWWAGLQERFVAVQWYGDEGGDGNYGQHVINAFNTAEPLKDYIHNDLMGTNSIIAGHSLGNMVISSAIQDHSLSVDKYYMLNAAVAKEACDASATNHSHMIHNDWEGIYNTNTWAANYYVLFDASDDRSKLNWRGRFPNVVNKAFTFYSTGDEVFETKSDIGFLSGATGDTTFMFPYSWQKNELYKGLDYGFDWIEGLGTHWAGWEFNREYHFLFDADKPETWPIKYTASEANALTEAELKTNHVFRVLNTPSAMFSSTISDEQLAELLAKAIPATTRTAGKESAAPFAINDNEADMNADDMRIQGWPAERDSDPGWHHNDLFEVAFPYVTNVFLRITGATP